MGSQDALRTLCIW